MYVELETSPFMEKNILNFHFDYLHSSLRQDGCKIEVLEELVEKTEVRP